MKTIKIVALSLLLFTLSCSKSSTSDDDEVKNPENSIVGYWIMTDLVVNENASTEIQAKAQSLKSQLRSIGCNIVSIDIRADKTVTMDIFNVGPPEGSDPDNPELQCKGLLKQTGTWIFGENELTLTSSGGLSDSATVRFESSRTAFVSADPFGELGDLATELYFEKLIEI